MRKLLVIAMVLLQTVVCSAQMDVQLQRLAHKQETAQQQNTNARRPDTEQVIRVIAQIKADARLEQIASELTGMGVKVMADYGRIGILNIPVSKLYAVSEIAEIEYLSEDRKVRINNDLAREDMQVDSVQNLQLAQELGLTGTYDGTGVLVGVVDCGIDFNHAAFRDKDGNTRIKMVQIYDTREGEEPECMDSIRQTYLTPEEISSLTSDGSSTMSHGSHTSCTAAGSPVTIGDSITVQGMAPGADLLLTSMYSAEGETYDSYCMDAIYNQIKYAEEAGKPIVINLSLGELTFFRDGKEPINVLCESLTGPGRVICFSAGNSGNKKHAIEYTPQTDADTIRTILYDTSNFYRKGLKVMVSGEDSTPFQVRLGCLDLFTMAELPFQFYTPDSIPVPEEDIVFCSTDEMHDNRYAATVDIPEGFAVEKELPYLIFVEVIGKQGKPLRITSRSEVTLQGTTDGRYMTGTNINSQGYHTESDSVISVGSYVSRSSYTNGEGRNVIATRNIQEPSAFSSDGTTIYGKTIPDMLAPGEYLLSAFNAYDNTKISQETGQAVSSSVCGYSEMFGRKSWFGMNRGTSMACPAATGVIALWLQADPTLGPSAVREVIQKTSLITPLLEERYSTVTYGSGLMRAAAGLKYIEEKKRGIPDPVQSLERFLDRPVRMYNLSGQPVDEPVSGGIYIIGGQKVLK